MRYCRFCHRLSLGKPHYCRFCRRSFNLKLCASGHANVRGASFCEQCGSSDLSSPQPRFTGFVVLVYFLVFFMLTFGTLLYLLLFVRTLLADPNNLLTPMLMGLGIGILWLIFVTVTDTSR